MLLGVAHGCEGCESWLAREGVKKDWSAGGNCQHQSWWSGLIKVCAHSNESRPTLGRPVSESCHGQAFAYRASQCNYRSAPTSCYKVSPLLAHGFHDVILVPTGHVSFVRPSLDGCFAVQINHQDDQGLPTARHQLRYHRTHTGRFRGLALCRGTMVLSAQSKCFRRGHSANSSRRTS